MSSTAAVTTDPTHTSNGVLAHPPSLPDDTSALVASLSLQIESSLASLISPHPSLTPELILAATQSALNSLLDSRFPSPPLSTLLPTSSSASPYPSPPPHKPVRTYIDGCFDIMHSGHYNAIRQAKALTDVLVVGVHSDAEILKHKGPPVMNNEERLATVRACKWVDEVVFDTPYDPSLQLLDDLHCDFCVHGDDMSTTADGKDAYEQVKRAGRMKIVKRTEGISTTDLVGRLLLMTKQHHISLPVSPSLSPRHQPTGTSVQAINTSPKHARTVPSFLLDAQPLTGSPAGGRRVLTLTPSTAARTLPIPPASSTPLPPSTPLSPLSDPHPPASIPDSFASKGISNFLPTTWRIAQFSNNRTPSPSDVVVYIDGAFDLFHVGHIETLKRARALGTFLYVGLHDDLTVNRHRGRNYPIMNLHERVMNVLSCAYVDEVVIGAPWVCGRDLVKSLGVHLVATGSNSKFAPGEEQGVRGEVGLGDPYAEVKELGMYREIDTSYLLETEQVVERIVDNRLKFEKRNEKRSAKEKTYLTSQKQYVQEI